VCVCVCVCVCHKGAQSRNFCWLPPDEANHPQITVLELCLFCLCEQRHLKR